MFKILKRFLHPQPTYLKYNDIKRGWFANLKTEDINYFNSFLTPSQVITDQSLLDAYNVDWLQECKGSSRLVLRPKTVQEVSKIVSYCNDRKLAIVPQGGNTGLVHGSIPVFDEIILSMSSMNKVLSIDQLSGVVICEAGCVQKTLDETVSAHGLIVPLDLGSKGSCQIGGNVATNAGGVRLICYGSLRGSVLGLEVVLPNGEICNMLNTVRKDNTGYDLKQLFIGSEGTLGIITKISLLCPIRPKDVNVALFGCSDFQQIIEAYKLARQVLGETLSAFEFMDKACIETVISSFKDQYPFKNMYPYYFLVESGTYRNKKLMQDADQQPNYKDIESESTSISTENLMLYGTKLYDMITNNVNNNEVSFEGTLAKNTTQYYDIWKLREHIYPALSENFRQKTPNKEIASETKESLKYENDLRQDQFLVSYDVSIPITHWKNYIADMVEIVNRDALLSVQENLGYALPKQLLNQENNGDMFQVYCLIEASGNMNVTEVLQEYGLQLLPLAISEKNIIISQSLEQMSALWKLRESITASLLKDGYVYKYDISVSSGRILPFVKEVRQHLTEKMGNKIKRIVSYGHFGDGNLHLNVTTKLFDQDVLDALQPYIYQMIGEGSLSAEHGVGLCKKDYISHINHKSLNYWHICKQIKQLVDPHQIMNPYKMFSSYVRNK